MSDRAIDNDRLLRLIDAVLDDRADDAAHRELADRIARDREARAVYLSRATLHAMLRMHPALAPRQLKQMMDAGDRPAVRRTNPFQTPRWVSYAAVAAAIAVAAVVWIVAGPGNAPDDPPERQLPPAAVLTGADNVAWRTEPINTGLDVRPGEVEIDSGTVMMDMLSGTTVRASGAVSLRVVGRDRVVLRHGRLDVIGTPGFTVDAPGNLRVVDLGTRFVIDASEGSVRVRVLEGAVSVARTGEANAPKLTIDAGELAEAPIDGPIHVRDGGGAFTADFTEPGDGLLDRHGQSTPLTARLPGTGNTLGEHDANLTLDSARGALRIRGGRGGLNGQTQLGEAEYPGVPARSIGFTGGENVSVRAAIAPPPAATEAYQQFGVYVGASSRQATRVGFLHADNGRTIFSANTRGGLDLHQTFKPYAPADHSAPLLVTVARLDGVWRMTVNGIDVTPTEQPTWLNDRADLVIGVFAEENTSRTDGGIEATVTEFEIDVQPHRAEATKESSNLNTGDQS